MNTYFRAQTKGYSFEQMKTMEAWRQISAGAFPCEGT